VETINLASKIGALYTNITYGNVLGDNAYPLSIEPMLFGQHRGVPYTTMVAIFSTNPRNRMPKSNFSTNQYAKLVGQKYKRAINDLNILFLQFK